VQCICCNFFWLVTIRLLVSDRERIFVVMQCWSIRLINVLCWLSVCPSVTSYKWLLSTTANVNTTILSFTRNCTKTITHLSFADTMAESSRVSCCVQIIYRQTSVLHRTSKTVRVRSYQGLQTYSDSWTQHLLSLWSGVYTTPPSILLHVWCPTTSYDDESTTER